MYIINFNTMLVPECSVCGRGLIVEKHIVVQDYVHIAVKPCSNCLNSEAVNAVVESKNDGVYHV